MPNEAETIMISKSTLECACDWFDYFVTDGEINRITYNFDLDQTAIDEIATALAAARQEESTDAE